MMTVFDQTLFRAVPRPYREVEAALANGEPGAQPPTVPAFVRFGSWVGGDPVDPMLRSPFVMCRRHLT